MKWGVDRCQDQWLGITCRGCSLKAMMAYNFPAQAGMNPSVPLPQKRVMAQPHQQKEEGSVDMKQN
ncbi:hypothetical protein F2Q69_00025384 [Brassica cretica]|uniref:Uncharacterized protein n=1 Tax=Brassica cretica TaxID=69181 RepID=A0A8S9QIY3_BRACR|nr:hypothetical protein F2Q69_00025384 [Brassica cretica]